jgi:hypothetical protein
VRIYGLDFTSAPGDRKPLIVLGCTLERDEEYGVSPECDPNEG